MIDINVIPTNLQAPALFDMFVITIISVFT